MNEIIPARHTPQNIREQGFTLIEVLFAVVFLAAGLLGIAALEDIALARNIDARRLTAATNAATEMLERVRFNAPANSTAFVGAAIPAVPYLYHGVVACSSATLGVPSNPGAACASAPAVANVGNTGSNAAATGDYAQWAARLAQLDSNGVPFLPNAVGQVTSTVIGPVGPGPTLGQIQVEVTVGWTAGLRNPTVYMVTFVAPL